MNFNPEKHHRKSIRLKGYDYSDGGYFVTICVKDRQCIFGEIINGEMVLSDIGVIVKNEWKKTEELRKNVIIDEFIIMPNHMHGIVFFDYENERMQLDKKGRMQYAPTGVGYETKFESPKNNLGSVIRGFKSSTTKQINELTQGRIEYAQISYDKLWQRNYHEWVIRDEKMLDNVRNYIHQNPLKWEIDSENPYKKQSDKNNIEYVSSHGMGLLNTHNKKQSQRIINHGTYQ